MTIAQVLENRDQTIISCTADATVEHAARKLAENRIGALPVLDGGKPIGIFSERDLLYCIAHEGADVLRRPVSEVMTAPAITVDSSTGVMDALELMTRRRIRHLPVVDKGRLSGFVSIGDLVKHRLDKVETEARQMREYIRTV
ncbi:CBS domain-containing protein [Altericroceibacterium xinjiangense]|uniref:CBS domain-containing protein n=1 Tax=Altericroceibacterium xinjiangense TaxID=762261 RepID=UPI000F7E9DBD|nr:CBS domain-containing protein [Altericroceibacterium xinjiangense]